VLYLRKFKDISKAVQLLAIAQLRKLRTRIASRDCALELAVELFDELNSIDTDSCVCTVVVITSERSCCGKLNNAVLAAAREAIDTYIADNKVVRIVSVGWKGSDSLSATYKSAMCKSVSAAGTASFFLSYVITLCIGDTLFDKCSVFFSKYNKIFEQVAAVYEFKS
jgi:F0F1-type ATP synthase gamma subunit